MLPRWLAILMILWLARPQVNSLNVEISISVRRS
jgi:hypothetical protein